MRSRSARCSSVSAACSWARFCDSAADSLPRRLGTRLALGLAPVVLGLLLALLLGHLVLQAAALLLGLGLLLLELGLLLPLLGLDGLAARVDLGVGLRLL